MTCEICRAEFVPSGGMTWKRFCSRSCAGKFMGTTVTHAERVRRGREGAAVRLAIKRDEIASLYTHLPRELAIWAAFKAGQQVARRRARREGAA